MLINYLLLLSPNVTVKHRHAIRYTLNWIFRSQVTLCAAQLWLCLPSKHLYQEQCQIKCVRNCCLMFHQITVVETVAEVKAAASVEIVPTPTTEPTAKPPPFKAPSFTVSVHLGLGLPASIASQSVYLLLFSCLYLGSTLGLVEQLQAKRIGPGRISSRFWL